MCNKKMKNIKQYLDLTFWKFILVGIINTLVGTTVMFVAYNLCHLNYWVSSASNYIDWYKNEGKNHHIHGLGTMDAIFADIVAAVEKL